MSITATGRPGPTDRRRPPAARQCRRRRPREQSENLSRHGQAQDERPALSGAWRSSTDTLYP
ncbi:hypothetical protein X805_32900 [Sphaerotilus natans subsp. natans DSM 6575]|uniref:Uncharacterized protein n=1 Tax=Sphaerotilus natans subsp. natans DSM 6575 TaxID=1286631 RepID=A0A059KIE2_9BURK|nr:hypothetical protein X805_32900 [Sphaerotilus natans subsp. natans DSM 6575]